MLPLYRDPDFTFRFADDRIMSRFHVDGIEAGRRVAVYKLEAAAEERRGRIASAAVGEGGWADPPSPIIMRAGEGFVVAPEGPT